MFYGSRSHYANILIKGYNQIKHGIDYRNSRCDGIPPAETEAMVRYNAEEDRQLNTSPPSIYQEVGKLMA